MASDNEAERARLHGYIAGSQRVQRRLLAVVAALAAVSVVLVFAVSGRIGGLALLGTAIVGGCGYWVTAAHIADWRLRLRTMDERAGPRGDRVVRKRAR